MNVSDRLTKEISDSSLLLASQTGSSPLSSLAASSVSRCEGEVQQHDCGVTGKHDAQWGGFDHQLLRWAYRDLRHRLVLHGSHLLPRHAWQPTAVSAAAGLGGMSHDDDEGATDIGHDGENWLEFGRYLDHYFRLVTVVDEFESVLRRGFWLMQHMRIICEEGPHASPPAKSYIDPSDYCSENVKLEPSLAIDGQMLFVGSFSCIEARSLFSCKQCGVPLHPEVWADCMTSEFPARSLMESANIDHTNGDILLLSAALCKHVADCRSNQVSPFSPSVAHLSPNLTVIPTVSWLVETTCSSWSRKSRTEIISRSGHERLVFNPSRDRVASGLSGESDDFSASTLLVCTPRHFLEVMQCILHHRLFVLIDIVQHCEILIDKVVRADSAGRGNTLMTATRQFACLVRFHLTVALELKDLSSLLAAIDHRLNPSALLEKKKPLRYKWFNVANDALHIARDRGMVESIRRSVLTEGEGAGISSLLGLRSKKQRLRFRDAKLLEMLTTFGDAESDGGFVRALYIANALACLGIIAASASDPISSSPTSKHVFAGDAIDQPLFQKCCNLWDMQNDIVRHVKLPCFMGQGILVPEVSCIVDRLVEHIELGSHMRGNLVYHESVPAWQLMDAVRSIDIGAKSSTDARDVINFLLQRRVLMRIPLTSRTKLDTSRSDRESLLRFTKLQRPLHKILPNRHSSLVSVIRNALVQTPHTKEQLKWTGLCDIAWVELHRKPFKGMSLIHLLESHGLVARPLDALAIAHILLRVGLFRPMNGRLPSTFTTTSFVMCNRMEDMGPSIVTSDMRMRRRVRRGTNGHLSFELFTDLWDACAVSNTLISRYGDDVKDRRFVQSIIVALLQGVERRDRLTGLRVRRSCFVARDAIEFMVRDEIASDEEHALLLGNHLLFIGAISQAKAGGKSSLFLNNDSLYQINWFDSSRTNSTLPRTSQLITRSLSVGSADPRCRVSMLSKKFFLPTGSPADYLISDSGVLFLIHERLRFREILSHTCLLAREAWHSPARGIGLVYQQLLSSFDAYNELCSASTALLQCMRIVCRDEIDNSSQSIIHFAHPGFANQTFRVGTFATVRLWRMLAYGSDSDIGLTINDDMWMGALSSQSPAKELMQSAPDLTRLYEQGKVQEARSRHLASATELLEALAICEYLDRIDKNKTPPLLTPLEFMFNDSWSDVVIDALRETCPDLIAYNPTSASIAYSLHGHSYMYVDGRTQVLLPARDFVRVLLICIEERLDALTSVTRCLDRYIEGRWDDRTSREGKPARIAIDLTPLFLLRWTIVQERRSLEEIVDVLPTHSEMIRYVSTPTRVLGSNRITLSSTSSTSRLLNVLDGFDIDDVQQELMGAVAVKDRHTMTRLRGECFVGSQAIEVIAGLSLAGCQTRLEAMYIGCILVASGRLCRERKADVQASSSSSSVVQTSVHSHQHHHETAADDCEGSAMMSMTMTATAHTLSHAVSSSDIFKQSSPPHNIDALYVDMASRCSFIDSPHAFYRFSTHPRLDPVLDCRRILEPLAISIEQPHWSQLLHLHQLFDVNALALRAAAMTGRGSIVDVEIVATCAAEMFNLIVDTSTLEAVIRMLCLTRCACRVNENDDREGILGTIRWSSGRVRIHEASSTWLRLDRLKSVWLADIDAKRRSDDDNDRSRDPRFSGDPKHKEDGEREKQIHVPFDVVRGEGAAAAACELKQSDCLSLADVAKILRRGVTLQEYRRRLQVYRDVFVGGDAVDVLIRQAAALNRTQAVVLGNVLMSVGVFRRVESSATAVFVDDRKTRFQFQ